MQVNPINIKTHNRNNLAFGGYKKYENSKGLYMHRFFYPYDSERFNVEIEIVPVKKDAKLGFIRDGKEVFMRKSMPSNGRILELSDAELFSESQLIGYRYVVTEKRNNKRTFTCDSGILTKIIPRKPKKNEKEPRPTSHIPIYTVIFPDRTPLNPPKLTKQIMPDIYYPGYYFKKLDNNWTNSSPKTSHEIDFDKDTREKALKAIRHQNNILGGNFAGIIKMIPRLKEEGYTRIIGTPFTRDDVTSHLYWTKNAYQVAQRLGTIEDFKTMQIDLFKNGINWIADGAFINEGVDGIHFQDVMKYGKDSLYEYWFRFYGLERAKVKIPLIASEEAFKHLRMKLINSPYKVDTNKMFQCIMYMKNDNYDPKHETFIQLFDDRFVPQNLWDDSNVFIESYDKTNLPNPYAITKQDDIVPLTKIRINPAYFKYVVKGTFREIKKMKKRELYDINHPETIRNLLIFNFSDVSNMPEDIGYETWNGNVNVAKLRFYNGMEDRIEAGSHNPIHREYHLKRRRDASLAVQDYTIRAAQYWTKTVANTYIEYISNLLRGTEPTAKDYIQKISEEIKKKNLPESMKETVTDEVIKNVFNGDYKFKKQLNRTMPREEMLLREMYDFPFESLDFSNDVLALICSPCITRRPTNLTELLMSRYEIWQKPVQGNQLTPSIKRGQKQFKKLYENFCLPYVNDVLDRINDELPEDKKLFIHKEPTDFCRQVLPLIMPDIMKYMLVKMIVPNVTIPINLKTGAFDYSQTGMQTCTSYLIDLIGSPDYKAEGLIKFMRKQLKTENANIMNKKMLAKAIAKRVNRLDETSIQMAELIIDRTQAGLGWRIDAAKDIVTTDTQKTRHDEFDEQMKFIISFWKNFATSVKKENPHSYITAEVTDIAQLMGNKPSKYFTNAADAELKFILESGINNTANYTHLYSLLKNLISKDMETGSDLDMGNVQRLKDTLDAINSKDGSDPGYLYQLPQDGVMNSYTFLSNHDKPRILHTFALDMEVFNTDEKNERFRRAASRLLDIKDESEIDYTNISRPALAMSDRLNIAFKESVKSKIINDEDSEKIRKALIDLMHGHFKDTKFAPAVYAARPFEMVIENAIEQATFAHGLNLSDKVKEELSDYVLKSILIPSMDRLKTAYKMLVTLPGAPTDFCGDKEGSTGGESSSGNIHQQCRNVIRYEWLGEEFGGTEKDAKPYIKDFYDEMTEIGKLRSRKELSALTDGSTISLPIQTDRNTAGVFRYNDKGSQVICLYSVNPYKTIRKKEDDKQKKDEPEKLDRNEVNITLEALRAQAGRVDRVLPRMKKTVTEIILSSTDDEQHKEGLFGGFAKEICVNRPVLFKNANPKDKSLYEIYINKDKQYCIRKKPNSEIDGEENKYNDTPQNIEFLDDDNHTLILYRYDENEKSSAVVQTSFNYPTIIEKDEDEDEDEED